MNRFLPIVFFLLLAVWGGAACSSCHSGTSGQPGVESVTPGSEFPMIEIPGMIADAQDRVDYFAEHFWDRFAALSGPTDSLSVHGIERNAVEEKFVFWVALLKTASPQAMEKSVREAVRSARTEAAKSGSNAAMQALIDMADRQLYDPNAPGRNEEAYLFFLQELLSGTLPDESMRMAYEYYTKLCSLNRPGNPASDFAFITREGRVMNLYDVKAPVLLMIFSNPGCPLCASYQEYIQKNAALSEKLAKGDFKVLNIYPDEDVAAWEEYARTYPKEWICGRDHLNQLFANNLYSLRAIPSLYLLDADKKVILKDAPYEEVEMKLYDLLF
ncbi:MAG: DUF5106 domain-containing protein [Bacteroidales bacterium]|nr:DUF5106 domain-containing protein [Bacteroidales bacterium]